MKSEKRVKDNIKSYCNENTMMNNHSEIIGLAGAISNHQLLFRLKMNVQLVKFIIVTFSTVFSPLNSFAQLPNLGTAMNFAVFTTTGALGNTGTSNISGDIGTNNGATSGFGAPTVVNGSIESTNSITAQCAIDVQSAYNEIFSIAPTVVDHSPSFGSGESLLPGVYLIGAAGSVAGNLTLDAAGNSDAIFIFQFGGAFTTGASSTINLINGALSCNVFWIAEGAMSIGAIADMKGSLISNNGAISMEAGGTLDGRMLSTAGAAFVYDALITMPTCKIFALPINLLTFTGHCNKQNIVLQWETTTEVDNDYFTIEQSLNGHNWQIVGRVTGGGNSSLIRYYTLTDLIHHKGTIYYRLKQTDFNGNYTYKATINITNCEDGLADHLTIYPNPSKGKFKLLFHGDTSEINSIEVFNSQGQNIYSAINFQSTFDLSNNVPGLYFIQVRKNSEIVNLRYVLSN